MIRLYNYEKNFESIMTSSKPRKSSSSFKVVKSFNFPGGLESNNAAVKLEPSGLVNTWLHDFRVAYTLGGRHRSWFSFSHAGDRVRC